MSGALAKDCGKFRHGEALPSSVFERARLVSSISAFQVAHLFFAFSVRVLRVYK